MKPCIVLLWGKLMLRKRSLIETVNDQLKNICQVDHTRHRSVNGFIVNLLACTHQPMKPGIRFDENEKQQLASALKQDSGYYTHWIDRHARQAASIINSLDGTASQPGGNPVATPIDSTTTRSKIPPRKSLIPHELRDPGDEAGH